MIRIVYNREINVDHIAQRLSTTHTSVHNVARTITDKGGVWESTPEIQRPRPAVMAIPIPKPVAAKRTWLLPTSAVSRIRFDIVCFADIDSGHWCLPPLEFIKEI
ncbi:hypothetical protein C0989_004675 [Termitomyces sp. Mn162]|nr:hypothetical protein C0989_004675 [Termitomyces sp. Mn162]